VNRTGHEFLAGAALAVNHDRCVRLGHVVDQVEEALHQFRAPHHPVKRVVKVKGATQGLDLRLFPNQLGHVGEGLHGADDLTVVIVEHRRILENMNGLPVFVGDGAFLGPHTAAGVKAAENIPASPAQDLAPRAIEDPAAFSDEFDGLVAGEPLRRRVDGDDVAPGAHDDEAVLKGVHDGFPVISDIHHPLRPNWGSLN
jgi:hypothetical protein